MASFIGTAMNAAGMPRGVKLLQNTIEVPFQHRQRPEVPQMPSAATTSDPVAVPKKY